MSRLPIRSSALTSSLLVAASVLAAFWLVSLSFNYELPTLISCAVLVPSGMLLGSLRRLLLHGAVILVSTIAIWNTPWIWSRVFLLPAPDRSIAEPVLLSIVMTVLFALGIAASGLVARLRHRNSFSHRL